MKINLHICASYLLVGSWIIINGSPLTHAGTTVYQFKESNGVTVLTNNKGNYRHLKVEKKTYYPDSNIHTYSNWGSNEAAVLPSHNKDKNAFDHIIRQAAQQHGISEGLIKAVMHTESGFNVNARSPVGAQGLMQLMPATARRFNVSNAYDPQQNIMAGAKYLAWLMNRFNGNSSLALAGYNAGEGNVAKYNGIPPFRETQDYVRRVNSRYQNLYANGIGSSSSHSNNQARIIASSEMDQKAQTATQNTTVTQAAKYQRQIIMTADGRYTDTPTGAYATANATASAKLYGHE